MKYPSPTLQRKTGRPLSFDRYAVLKRAMLVFWQHGYETTSLADLTAAMGVTAPSIYTAFGDKKRLFLEAVALYAGEPLKAVEIIDAALDARAAAEALLTSSAIAYTGENTPRGCLLASSVASCSTASDDVQASIANIRRRITASLVDKIRADIKDGETIDSVNADTVAGLIMTVVQGMAILARDGAPRDHLLAIAEAAMAIWPQSIQGQEIEALGATT